MDLGLALGAGCPLIMDETLLERGMKVAASPIGINSLPLEGKVPRRGG